MPEKLGTTALPLVLLAQRPAPDLVVHSDRGGQYGGNTYRQLLHGHQALRSQSRRGDCDDNAQTENRLKVVGAAGRASKRRSARSASGPFLPTWPMPKPVSPTIRTTTTTSACTSEVITRCCIALINNHFKSLS